MLKDRNVLLTGANRGIGNAVLQLLARNHANFWCLVRTVSKEFLRQVRQMEQQYNIWIKVIEVDLSREDSIRGAVRLVCRDDERIDILINNAGMNHRGSFLMTPRSEMEHIYSVNYFAPIQLIQLAAKKMIRQKEGNIINICSVSGMEHNVGNFSYASSKAALIWATQTISRELAPYHIKVNGIAPGVTDTEINRGNEQIIQERVLERMNIKRVAAPEEIAQGVLFLVSGQSSFVSGQILRIDGGRF